MQTKSISSSTRLMGQLVGMLMVLVLGVSLQALYKTLNSRGELLVLYKNKLAKASRVRKDIKGRISSYAMVMVVVIMMVVMMVRKMWRKSKLKGKKFLEGFYFVLLLSCPGELAIEY
jgi:hypothetical protein